MVVVEVEEPETGGNVRAARGDTIETAKETLEDALNKVLPAAHSIVEKLQAIRPDTIEVTFGIKLSFKAGAFITAGADANFEVKVRRNFLGAISGKSRLIKSCGASGVSSSRPSDAVTT